jgi:cold shock CspA family protein
MSKAPTQDEIRYCDRCGVAFLWTVEEQRAAPSPVPLHCPACHRLLPPDARERGLVKWYNIRKRYGFIVRRAHPEIFAHGGDLLDGGRLHPGDLVEFDVEEGERGPAAKAIRVIGRADDPVID